MVGLFPRFDPTDFFSYFGTDCRAKMWKTAHGTAKICLPRAAILRAVDRSVIAWEPLTPERFERIIEVIAGTVGYEKTSQIDQEQWRVIALEAIYSAPKSVSVAALAGGQVAADIVAAHAFAVDQTLAWARPFILTRRKERMNFEVLALRFPHPFSALKDPQLHDHVALVWLLEGRERQGALHGYPFFFHLLALRFHYHYTLASCLAGAGYSIVRTENAPHCWELAGVDAAVTTEFSQRSQDIVMWSDMWSDYESVGAARRYAALGSRGILAETPDISLDEGREMWAQRMRVLPAWRPIKSDLFMQARLEIGEIKPYFDASAVTTRAMLTGRILGGCLGQNVPVAAACEQIESEIEIGITRGELVAKELSAVCHRKAFLAEKKILDAVRSGLTNGNQCRLVLAADRPKKERIPKRLASAAKRMDRIRIISARGHSLGAETALEIVKKNGPVEAPWLVLLSRWDTSEVLALLKEDHQETGGTRDLMVVIEEADHAGDFLRLVSAIASVPGGRSLKKMKQMRVGERAIEIQEGILPTAIGQRFPRLEERSSSELKIVVAGDGYPEDLRLGWNLQAGRDWVLHQPNELKGPLVTLDIPVPWPEPGAAYDWKGKGLFAFQEGAMHHGNSWTIEDASGEPCHLTLRGKRKSRIILASELLGWQETVALVRRVDMRYVSGLQLEVLLSFEKVRLVLRRGEVVLIKTMVGNAIELEDGRVVPDCFRAFAPVLIQADFHPDNKRPPDVIYVANPMTKDIVERLNRYQSAQRIIVMAPDVTKAKTAIAGRLHMKLHEVRQKKIVRLCEGKDVSEYGIIPPRGSWQIDEVPGEELKPEGLQKGVKTVTVEMPAPVLSEHVKREDSVGSDAPTPSKVENIPGDIDRDSGVEVAHDRTVGTDADFTRIEVVPADAVVERPPVSHKRSRLEPIAMGSISEEPVLSKKTKVIEEEDQPKGIQKNDSEQPLLPKPSAGKSEKKKNVKKMSGKKKDESGPEI